MNEKFLEIKTPKEISMLIANRLRNIRKRKKISQKILSEKAGVSLGSLKRFESSGEIAFVSLIKLSIALHCENEILSLFENTTYNSIVEVINEKN